MMLSDLYPSGVHCSTRSHKKASSKTVHANLFSQAWSEDAVDGQVLGGPLLGKGTNLWPALQGRGIGAIRR
jgi:hypothetical protein